MSKNSCFAANPEAATLLELELERVCLWQQLGHRTVVASVIQAWDFWTFTEDLLCVRLQARDWSNPWEVLLSL